MDGTSVSGKSGDERTAQHKTLTPAILGIPSGPHGAKLSSNMNLKDKEQLLLKLEAWREARKEKLISTIMAKGRQSSNLKLPSALPAPKMRTMSIPVTGTDAKQNTSDGKKNVFDRLYENASKAGVKKSEENKNEKPTTIKPAVKPSKYPPFGKCKVPKVILFNNVDDTSDPANETCKETTLSVPVEENTMEKPDAVETKNDELKKDVEGMNFDVKKSVCFETPKEKILSAVNLRNELEDWLTQKGHSLDSYRHLRCFGLHGEKTPISHQRQAKIDDMSNSSFYSTAPNTPVSEVIDESDKENVTPLAPAPKIDIKHVEGWLGDLHRLIVHEEYPSDRCEEWLNAITKKFPSCTQLPVYWECLAAMNGDISLLKSVEGNEESEKREGEEHETSIAELFDKLMIDEKCHSASKTERGLSTKNIFKSKTVKFALQEKSIKEMDPELGTEARRKVLVATPVRRSARLQTPDKSNIIGSLQSLDPETRRSVSFQPNEALLTG